MRFEKKNTNKMGVNKNIKYSQLMEKIAVQFYKSHKKRKDGGSKRNIKQKK